MSVGEYVAVFVSIILGIALGDLALSTHRLLRARERVEWHWVTPALALFMLTNIIAFWWASFNWYRELGDYSIGAFLPDVALFLLLFLGAAAVMPDEIPEGRFSLKDFYFREARYFWSLMIPFVIMIIVHVDLRDEPSVDWRAFLGSSAKNIFSLALMIPLLVTKRAWVHYSVIVVIMLMVGSDFLVETIES
jgi:hypothetical protein